MEVTPSLLMTIPGGIELRLGLDVGMLLVGEYSAAETIIQPDGAGTFIDAEGNDTHSRVRNASSGEIPNASQLRLGARGGISYGFPLDAAGTLILAPEVGYSLGLTSIAGGLAWRVNALRFGASLTFVSARPVSTPAVVEIPGSPPAEVVVLARGLSSGGVELPIVRLMVEEFAATLTTPLLNFIFFEEGESTLPARYARLARGSRDTFAIDRINSPGKLSTYHHLLDIVGRRLLDHPGATITLTGCNQDIGPEKGNIALSRERAEAVRDYLGTVWGIDTPRVHIEGRNLPRNAANTLEPDGAAENRRVEIVSSDPAILAPIVTSDTLRTVDPPSVRFIPRTRSIGPLARWEIVIRQDGRMLHRIAGEGALPPSIDWHIDGDPASTPRYSGPIHYTLTVVDSAGMTVSADGLIATEQMTIQRKRVEHRDDREIDRSSLILFDIRSAQLTDASRAILPFITGNITPQSTVTITGYTDRLGEETYNQTLSASRAESVARALGVPSVTARGLGEADLYDSSLPEGRLYARTVEVVIETPVEGR
jgi:outer membrane protein OmpA-like peptidoglycan-associated protein